MTRRKVRGTGRGGEGGERPPTRAEMDGLRDRMAPFVGKGSSVWCDVVLRPSLRFALVPKAQDPGRPSGPASGKGSEERKEGVGAETGEEVCDGFIEGFHLDAGDSGPGQGQGKTRGSGGLTRHGGRCLADLCALNDEDRHLFSLWTVTLPPEAAELMREGGGTWQGFQDSLRRRFSEALSRRSERAGIRDSDWEVGSRWWFVTEVQKNGRPHLHFVFRGRKRKGRPWLFSPRDLDKLIFHAVKSVLMSTRARREWERRGLSGVVSSGNVQQVKKSMGGYLSKYMGKGRGSQQVDAIRRAGFDDFLVPTAWWGCCRGCRADLGRYLVPLPRVLVSFLSSLWPQLKKEGVLDADVVQLEGEGAPTVVCGRWVGARGLVSAVGRIEEEALGMLLWRSLEGGE